MIATTPPPGSIFGMPQQGSTIAPDVDLVYDVVQWICVFFLVLITVVMVYFVVKYRRREHVADTGGATHNTPLEVTWTLIPLVLVIAIFYVGLKGYVRITTPPENTYDVNVVAQRWFWTFNYPNGATDGILHVPVGKAVKLSMRSDDVLHSLFVPAFRVKQDVVPGRTTHLWFQAVYEGEFDLFCAEYCGMDHSQMITKVQVHDDAEFEVFMEELQKWDKLVPDEDLHLAGVILYSQCASCHTVDGSKLIGPSFKETHDLFKSGGTRTLADGTTVTVDEDFLRHSIESPLDQIAATYPSSMPPGIGKQLGPRRVEAMVRFIEKLDEVAPGGKLIEVKREDIVVKEPEGK